MPNPLLPNDRSKIAPFFAMPQGAVTLGVWTLASRVLGFIRDIAIAALFGGTWMADSFLVAFRLPNLARRLLGEGVFAYTIVPAYITARKSESGQACGDAAAIFARSVILPVVAVFTLVAIAGIAFSHPLVLFLAPGLIARPEALSLTALLMALCLPYLPLTASVAGSASLLLAERRFRPVATAPLVFNCVILASVAGIAASNSAATTQSLYILASAVTAAGVAQWLWVSIPLAQHGFSLFGPVAFGKATHPSIVKVRQQAVAALCAMPGASFAASSAQINILAATILASFLEEGSISALYFAERLIEFPLGILGVSLGLSALTDLADSRFAPNETEQAAATQQRKALFTASVVGIARLTLFLALPAAVGAACLACPITALLFGHGAFTSEAVSATTLAFVAYAPGLPALALSRPLLAATSALGDTRAGTRAATASLALTLILGTVSFLLKTPWGLALAVSLAAWLHVSMLWRALARHGIIPSIGFSWLLRVLTGCALMAVCVLAVQGGLSSSFWRVFAGIPLGFCVYCAAGHLFDVRELSVCLAAFLPQRKVDQKKFTMKLVLVLAQYRHLLMGILSICIATLVVKIFI